MSATSSRTAAPAPAGARGEPRVRSADEGARLRQERRAQRHLDAARRRRVGDPARARHLWALWLVTVTWAWVVVPRLIQTVTAPKFRTSVGIDTPPYTGLASLALKGLTLALTGLCVLIVVGAVRDRHPGRPLALAVLLAPWVYLALRDSYGGQHLTRSALMYPLVVLAVWALRPRLSVLAWLGGLVGLSAVLSLVLGLLQPSKALLISTAGELVTEGKTVLPGGILVSFLTNGNTLGTFLALGLPLVALLSRRWVRWPLLLACTVALVWSASRSSFGAVAIAVAAAAVMALTPRVLRGVFGPLLVLVPVVLVCVLPLVTRDPTAFTNRGLIWHATFGWWHENTVFGLGADWYSRVGSSSERLASTVSHAHNQFLQLAVTGGVLLLVLVALQVLAVTLRSGRLAASGHSIGIVYLATLAGTCVLEKSFVLVDNTSLFPVVVLPLAVLMCGDLGLPERDGRLSRSRDGRTP